MSFEKLQSTSQRHTISLEALAALAAKLRTETEGITVDPDTKRVIDAVAHAMGFDEQDLAALVPEQRNAVVGMIRSFFRQAADLMDHPDRAPGWYYDDPVVLQSQGRVSMGLVPIIREISMNLGDLAARLDQSDGAFLDVGTGVGWLAIGMARAFPNLHVVGIDIWKPALSLAAHNVNGLNDRVTFREMDVTGMDYESAFDAVFMPGPFLPKQIVPQAIQRAHTALRPGGWLLFGLYTPMVDEQLPAALTDLRVVAPMLV